MKKFKLKEGIILTENQEGIIKEDGLVINLIPTWQWLLG